jgi:hypothetical protein
MISALLFHKACVRNDKRVNMAVPTAKTIDAQVVAKFESLDLIFEQSASCVPGLAPVELVERRVALRRFDDFFPPPEFPPVGRKWKFVHSRPSVCL